MTQTQKLWATLGCNMIAFGNIANGYVLSGYLFAMLGLTIAIYSHGFHSFLNAFQDYLCLGLPLTVLSLAIPCLDGLWFVIGMNFLSCFLFSFSSFKTLRFTTKFFFVTMLVFLFFSFCFITVYGTVYTIFMILCAFGPLQISYLLKCYRVHQHRYTIAH